MDSILALVDYISGFFDWIYTFWTDGIVDLSKEAMSWLMVKLTVWFIDVKIMAMKTAWGVAGSVLTQLNIGPVVSTYVGQLSPDIAYTANKIGLFDAFNMVMQAGVSSFVLRFFRL